MGPARENTEADPVPDDSLLTKQYGKGFGMLKKMGFKPGTGLGASGEGLTAPIEVSSRKPGQGIQDNEGSVPVKRTRKSKPTKRERRRGTSDMSSGDDDSLEELSDPDSSDVEESMEIDSPEDMRILEARRAVSDLSSRRKDIEYKIFCLNQASSSTSTDGDSLETLESLLSDIGPSSLLAQSIHDPSTFTKVLELVRDKYDSNSLWYELEAESVIAAYVSAYIDFVTDSQEVTSELIQLVRDLIVDDDSFARLLEHQLLPPLSLKPNYGLFHTIKLTTSGVHYASIYGRYLQSFFHTTITNDRGNISWLVEEGWIKLVPEGSVRQSLLTDLIKPRLVTLSSPAEVVHFRQFFDVEDWRGTVTRIVERKLKPVLQNLDPTPSHLTPVLEWAPVASPCVVGYLLAESKFLHRWIEIGRRDLVKFRTDRKFWILLASVCYHSPAKRVMVDALNLATGTSGPTVRRPRPGGPPPEFFLKSNLAQPNGGIAKISLGDVLKQECLNRGVTMAPRPGVRQDGCQVYKVAEKVVYWKDESLFERTPEANWIEIGIESLFR